MLQKIQNNKTDLDVIERKNYDTTKWITWNYEDRKLEPHPSLKTTLLELWPLDNETALRILDLSIGCWDWCIDLEGALEECLECKRNKGGHNEVYWNEYWKLNPELQEKIVSKAIEVFGELSECISCELDSIEFWDLDSKSRLHLRKFLDSTAEKHQKVRRSNELFKSKLLSLLRKANLPESLLLG
ncbi:hypothetical protein N8843_10095 [Verrucomicrobia bacterium]|nr:hypothetical protein [Verrucomicrobiota bacterium]